MSKIEKTLELNITHELLSLADSFWWYLQPVSLKRFWRPHWRFPLMPSPKSFATGLHINLEGKKKGGYDVCINSPSNFQGGNARLLFMQFKAGVEKPFNSNPSSHFYGDTSNPSVHIEFDINSNKNRNQHALLQDLALKAGNGNAVVYVFPRIINETQLVENVGKLLTKTSFITITEIDNIASDNSVTINDGNPHKFRTCYNNHNLNEINFFLFSLGKMKNPGSYIGEIIAIRMYRALESLKSVQIYDHPISRYHIMDAMIRHLFNIAIHFSVPLSKVEEYFDKYPAFQERLEYIYKYEDISKPYREEIQINERSIEIYSDIIDTLSVYFEWMERIPSFYELTIIPEPPKYFSIDVPQEGISYNLDDQNRNFKISDLDEIFYQLL